MALSYLFIAWEIVQTVNEINSEGDYVYLSQLIHDPALVRFGKQFFLTQTSQNQPADHTVTVTPPNFIFTTTTEYACRNSTHSFTYQSYRLNELGQTLPFRGKLTVFNDDVDDLSYLHVSPLTDPDITQYGINLKLPADSDTLETTAKLQRHLHKQIYSFYRMNTWFEVS